MGIGGMQYRFLRIERFRIQCLQPSRDVVRFDVVDPSAPFRIVSFGTSLFLVSPFPTAPVAVAVLLQYASGGCGSGQFVLQAEH